MEFYELLKPFGIPSYIAALAVLSYLVFKKIRPISLLSSNIFEKKLFSKDQLFSLFILRYFGETVMWMFINLVIIYIFGAPDWTGNPSQSQFVASIASLIGSVIFVVILIVNERKEKYPQFLDLNWVRGIAFFLFLCCVLIFYFSFNGTLIHDIGSEISIGALIFILILVFIFYLPIPIIMRSSLKFVYDRKEQNIYICANELRETDNPINGNDEINQHKWYILHAVNKELILLGNHPKEKLCTVTKIIKLEDLCNIKMSIEEVDQDSTNEESTNDSTTNNK
ncbi:hypothetical protein P9C93_04260 [Bacillus safensis]|uniref:hypothetical protein n=1 Tax=Bacillus safensis TaxID=561879 RepID=UPI002DBDF4DF|nr:hypothetical protein [Bacillus safensis]MEC1409814.1 hypothetical protein [Bacillus safensis]